MFDTILKPFGFILKFLADITGGSFALAVLIFTLLINLVMIPLSIKSQRSNAQQTRIRPKMDMLKKKYGDDKNRYNMELSKLYQEEKISTAGGCMPMLVRMIFLMIIFWSITRPLTLLLGVPAADITAATEALGALGDTVKSNYTELAILGNLDSLGAAAAPITQALQDSGISFSFFGLNLLDVPHFSMNIFGDFQMIWLIPLGSFAAAMLTSIVNMKLQKKVNPDAPRMTGLMLTMPLISLWIAFSVPGAVGLYWIYSNLISGGIQIVISQIYSPYKIIANDHAKAAIARREEEKKRMARCEAEAE